MTHPDLAAEIQAARADCLRIEHACQLAWGTGDYYKIKAANDAYDVAYRHLARLIKKRMSLASPAG
jgi:hypothetical protein